MAKARTQEEQRAIWRKRNQRRKNRLLAPQITSFKKSLANGAPVHQAIATAFPEVVTQKQAENKLKQLENNPLVREEIKVSQREYTKRLEKVIGEHPLDFIVREEVDIVESYKGEEPKYRAKSQPTLDSMKRSIGLDKADTGGKHLHLHLSTIKSEEERKDLLRILGGQKIDNESLDTESQPEQQD